MSVAGAHGMIVRFGTQWPFPLDWRESSDAGFHGRDGALELVVDDDGDLIDPGRCQVARDLNGGEWSLVRTINGVAMSGRYLVSGSQVLVYCMRPDVEALPAGTHEMPELQATYVFTGPNGQELLQEMRASIERQTITPREYGTLDAFGHSAMGPIPFLGSWTAVDGDTGNAPATTATVDVYLMLVGGGWIMFADDKRCCGMVLRPMAWRCADAGRAADLLRHEFAPRNVVARMSAGAHVWSCNIDPAGCSYTAYDAVGRVSARGAFWSDVFGQTWRVHYWFDGEHGQRAERILSTAQGGGS